MNEIDEVMKRLSEDATLLTPPDIDTLITWYRQDRVRFESGTKKPRGKVDTAAEGRELLKKLGLKTVTKPAMKRLI